MENSAPSDKPMEGKPTPSFDRFVLFVNKQSPTQSAKEALTVALNGNTQINNFNLLDKVDTIREDASSAAVQVLQDAPIPADKVWEMYEVLKSSPGVTHVEPLFYDMAARVPRVTEEAPPGHPDYWTIKAMNVEAAWKETEGKGILIGHLDTGYTLHPELGDGINKDKSTSCYDEGNGLAPPVTHIISVAGDYTHGTATASVMVAPRREPKEGEWHAHGVAPQAKIASIRTNDQVVYFSWGTLIDGIKHAISVGCNIISMSLGGPLPSQALRAAIQSATEKGLIVIAAAGNYMPGGFITWPARYPEVIAVAASNEDRKNWSYSSYGSIVAVTAPGEGVYRATWDEDTHTKPIVAPSSGTSYATAHVAAVCALWLSKHGVENLKEKCGAKNLHLVFRSIVSNTENCTPLEVDDKKNYGGGIIDAGKVVAVDPFKVKVSEEVLSAPSWTDESRLAKRLLTSIERTTSGRAVLLELVEEEADEDPYRTAAQLLLRNSSV